MQVSFTSICTKISKLVRNDRIFRRGSSSWKVAHLWYDRMILCGEFERAEVNHEAYKSRQQVLRPRFEPNTGLDAFPLNMLGPCHEDENATCA
jgi:hypothetical protein